MSDINIWVAVVAAYAALVATAALALEVRRWVEARARLAIHISPEMSYTGDADEDTRYLVVEVVNRGTISTTITHFVLEEYPTWWAALRRKQTYAAMILRPMPEGVPWNIPQVLGPGERWSGMARHTDDLVERAKGGRLYVAIYASHRNRRTIRRIIWREEPEGE